MGGAQPLAATLAGACSLTIECQQSRIDFRLRTRYVDEQAATLDDALARITRYTREGKPCPSPCARMRRISCRNWLIAACARHVTDQTSAHDPLHGYLPRLALGGVSEKRAIRSPRTMQAAKRSMAAHVRAMLAFSQMGADL